MDPLTATHDDLGFTSLDSVPASHNDTGLPMDTVPVFHEGTDTNMDPDLHERLPRSNLCVNCGVNTQRLKRLTLTNVGVRSIIQQWIAPLQVSENSPVCQPCWTLARNAQQHSGAQERSVGHRQVCVHCGKSVLRQRFHQLKPSNAGTRDILIRNIFAEWILPRLLASTDLVCHTCWTRARRAIPKYTPASTSIQNEAVNTDAASTEETSTEVLGTRETSPIAEPASEATIYLPNYIRAPISQHRCFYPRCNQPERLTVPTYLRTRLFIDFNFYVPATNRICNYHISNTFGNELTEVENPIHTFTAIQIEDYTDLLKQSQTFKLDFENMENMDSSIVQYWFGLSMEDILDIIKEVPRLATMHRGKTALAAYLIKLRTGDSDERISSLLNIPRSTLERLMGKVWEILKNEKLNLSQQIAIPKNENE